MGMSILSRCVSSFPFLPALPSFPRTIELRSVTAQNVAFGKHVDPKNESILSLVKFAEKEKVTTGKFTIGVRPYPLLSL